MASPPSRDWGPTLSLCLVTRILLSKGHCPSCLPVRPCGLPVLSSTPSCHQLFSAHLWSTESLQTVSYPPTVPPGHSIFSVTRDTVIIRAGFAGQAGLPCQHQHLPGSPHALFMSGLDSGYLPLPARLAESYWLEAPGLIKYCFI